jgi:2-keto-4-pentenoate hydratase/2-oxohepta-3-ene-1,7-dioic acid hydratase in catechol pathway
MDLLRFEEDSGPALGALVGGTIRLFAPHFQSIATVLQDPSGALDSASKKGLKLGEVTLLPPVEPSARIFAIAQNYPTHAKEVSGGQAPPAPVIFTKLHSSIVGPGEAILLPPITDFLDYEAEMAVIVGGQGANLSEQEADAIVAGVTCFNDVSARDLQWSTLGGREIVDWFSGKCLDQSSPIGPWIATIDDIKDVNDLALRCRVNGELVQDDRTSSMVFNVSTILSYISHRVRLQPGDVVATGTPAGVGRYRGSKLESGDVVEVEVEGVGILRNQVQSITSNE